MCGIVGWLSSSPAHPVDGSVLARMRDTMVHRGPDGEGLWVAPGREVALAFRRLAIVDLSATANQPMTNEDGTVQVVFNGEIYNHLALRRELLAKGHLYVAGEGRDLQFQVSGTDTGDGALRILGRVTIKMTDFGIQPPTAMLGLLKSKDEVTIHFDLMAEYDQLEEATS